MALPAGIDGRSVCDDERMHMRLLKTIEKLQSVGPLLALLAGTDGRTGRDNIRMAINDGRAVCDNDGLHLGLLHLRESMDESGREGSEPNATTQTHPQNQDT